MRIGPYTLPNPFILAPMASVSERPFRVIALEMGAALAPTELVSAQGLFRLSARTLRYLRYDPAIERPYSVQIFGGEPEVMAKAGVIAKEHGAQIIDVNMGCPVPKVTRNGAGSALMCDPPRAGAVISAIREATGLPVTAKIRAGWDSSTINAPQMAAQLEAAGAAAVAVHARTRAQGYSGVADWSLLRKVKESVSIPVIANGDASTPAKALQMLEVTGCDAAMIGRGALGNPWIFRQLAGGEAPSPDERAKLVLRHFDEHLVFVAEGREPNISAGVRSFRKHLGWYSHGLRGSSSFRSTVNRIDDPDAVRETIARFFGSTEVDSAAMGDEAEVDLRAAYG